MNDRPTQAVGAAGASEQAGRKRRKITAWMLVVRQNILPLAVAALTVLVFGRLGQAQEALFGTIGLAQPLPDAPQRLPGQYIGTQFFALAATIVMLGAAVWYSGRLLLTVDAATRTRLARVAVRRRASGIVEEFPRWMGAATAAALAITLIIAQSGSRDSELLALGLGLLATLGPLACVIYIAYRQLAKPMRLTGLLAGVTGAWFIVICLLIRLMRPADQGWTVAAALSMVCVLPALLYAAVAWRRPLLRWAGRKPRAANAGLQFTLMQGIVRLLFMGFLGGLMLLLLAMGPPTAARTLGSPAIALLAVTAGLCIACALTLGLRRLDHNRPGIVITAVVGLLLAYLVLHAAVGWRPFREQLGDEVLPAARALPAAAPAQSTSAPDIVVNAYGGGLRSALFTAQVLAELDDRSCGRFGQRLERLSGVSGGSLGLAVYLVLRQDLVAAGGWTGCTPGPATPRLAPMVEDVLLQDHLSAALARMLSVDLVPMLTPERGQALLDSWHDALTSQLALHARAGGGEHAAPAGLALPLRLLSGGLAPAPAVFFNTTRVHDGKRVWFSNRGVVGEGNTRTPLEAEFQLGQAVLHSARFPFVSPAGHFGLTTVPWTLVDGGYADNSGAATLHDNDLARPGRTWLNIDGNPPPSACRQSTRMQSQGVFSGLDTLLAVRRSQAELAVGRFAASKPGVAVPLTPDLEAAFRSTIEDRDKRCERIRELRSAPLGWYLTPVTVGDQRLARLKAVNEACAALKPLCG